MPVKVKAMRRCWLGVAVLVLMGCSDAAVSQHESVRAADDAIINGTPDFDHDAVVAVFSSQGACTATVIYQAGQDAFVLTAAHCFNYGPLEVVVVADDYNAQGALVLQVQDYQIHPNYNDDELTYDFAMVRAKTYVDVDVIPALTPSEDTIASGTPLIHLGYGLTSYPNGETSQRHRTNGSVDQVGQVQFAYDQPTSGPCSGDSGGPNLVVVSGEERVAGVVSYGDQTCSNTGVSGRVSAVYNSFIVPFIGTDPSVSTSASSSTAASSGAGVGGGGATVAAATAGVGGQDPGGATWTAGNREEQDIDGYILSSCGISSQAPAESPARQAAMWLLALALAAGLRRRRS